MTEPTLLMTQARQIAEERILVNALRAENGRLRELVKVLLDNDPAEPIADNGGTVLDGWRHDARRLLSS